MNTNTVLLLGRLIVGISAVGGTSAYVVNTINQQGVVTGILYIDEEIATQMEAAGIGGSSIVIDGQILKSGETIYGVKVVGIERLHAEFEKNGVRWKQRVREKPNSAWEEPD